MMHAHFTALFDYHARNLAHASLETTVEMLPLNKLGEILSLPVRARLPETGATDGMMQDLESVGPRGRTVGA